MEMWNVDLWKFGVCNCGNVECGKFRAENVEMWKYGIENNRNVDSL